VPRRSGICKLCLVDKPLASSHLIPAGVYKYIRKGEHRPIRVGGGIVLPTDDQTQTYLLCDDCENILSHGGEAWVVGKLLTLEKKFPLYNLLTQRKPNFDIDGILIYCAAQNPQLKPAKLTHFALGIFWKASVHSWGLTETDSLIELGPYSEKIRLWLRSEGSFPEHVYPVAIVSRPQTTQPNACLPFEQTRDQHEGDEGTLSWRSFRFQVPGLSFVLNIGKTVDQGIRALSLHTPPHPINVADCLTAKSKQIFAEHFHRNRKPKAFWNAMERLRRERSGPKGDPSRS
jgi:hypothetical protein